MRLMQDAHVAIMIACFVLSACAVLSATNDGGDSATTADHRGPAKSGRVSIHNRFQLAQVELSNSPGKRAGPATAPQAQPKAANATVPDGGSTAAWLGLGLLGLSYLGGSKWGRNQSALQQGANTERIARSVSPADGVRTDGTEQVPPAERQSLWH